MVRSVSWATMVLAGLVTVTPADAGPVSVQTSAGLADLAYTETVWDGTFMLSRLNWHSAWVVLATADAQWEFAPGWTLALGGRYGTLGSGEVSDYDWQVAATTDWSDRSISTDTRLDLYAGGRAVLTNRILAWGSPGTELTFDLGLGAAWTGTQWTAYGGDFVYTPGHAFAQFRQNVGTFPAGTKSGTYFLSLPEGFARVLLGWGGPGAGLGLEVDGGSTFFASDVDTHWRTDARYFDHPGPAPLVGARVEAHLGLGAGWTLRAGADYRLVFLGRGSTTAQTMSTGATSSQTTLGGIGTQTLGATVGLGWAH